MINKREMGRTVLMAMAVVLAWGPTAASSRASRPTEPRVIKMTAQRFKFVPSRIKVRAGEEFKLRISSRDVTHGFRLPELNLETLIPPKRKGPIELKLRFDKPGKYAFRCSHVCGAGHASMRGMFVVKAAETPAKESSR